MYNVSLLGIIAMNPPINGYILIKMEENKTKPWTP
jgi:hypothetical protein